MDNIQAALLIDKLKRIEHNWQRREEICRMYETAVHGNENITCLKIVPNSKSARHLFTILVHPDKRDSILWQLQEKGIGVAVNYRAIHLLTFYRQKYCYKIGYFPDA